MDEQKQEELTPEQEEQKEAELATFKRAYRLTANSMTILMKEAVEYYDKMAAAKTAPKIKLYEKKFKRVKSKFQDELTRLIQLEHILKTNGIDPKSITSDDVKSAEEQVEEFIKNGDDE